MPYVKRNAGGEVVGLLDYAEDGAGEEISLDAPEIQAFFARARQRLSLSDTELGGLGYLMVDEEDIL